MWDAGCQSMHGRCLLRVSQGQFATEMARAVYKMQHPGRRCWLRPTLFSYLLHGAYSAVSLPPWRGILAVRYRLRMHMVKAALVENARTREGLLGPA